MSAPARRMLKHWQGQRIPDLLSILAVDPDSHIYFTADQSLAFGFLCDPLPGSDQQATDRINTFLNQDWPAGSIIQFSLWASPDVYPAVREFSKRRVNLNPLLQKYSESVVEVTTKGAVKPIIKGHPLITRECSLLISCKVPLGHATPTERDMERTRSLQEAVERGLQTIGIRGSRLDRDSYLRVMNTLLNWSESPGWQAVPPKADDSVLLREQIADFDRSAEIYADGIDLGGRFVKTLSVKQYPRYAYYGLAAGYLGELFTGARGIRENVLITATIHFPDDHKTRERLNTKRQWTINQAQGPLLKFVPELLRKKEGFDALYEAFQNGDRPVHIYLGMALFGRDRQDAATAVSNARTYWSEMGFSLIEDRFVTLPCFLNCLPFEADREAIRDLHRYRTMATRHVIPLLPIFADWKGTGTPDFLLYSRNGQVMRMSLYDSDASYNGVIAAQSGSGKSFLTNEIISAYLSLGGQIWVIDVGRSYEKICDLYGGDYMEFESDKDIGISPFPLIRNYAEEEDMLAGLIVAMAAPTEQLSDLQMAELKRVLKTVWERTGRSSTVDDLSRELVANDDRRIQDIGRQLYPFTTEGEYGRYLRENTIAFDKPLTVLELEGLKGRRHLQQVVLLELIYQIQQAVYRGRRDRPKLLIIDEAWDLLGAGNVAAFINDAYRRFRKYGAAAIVILQSIADLYENAVGRAIAENSPNMYLLNQKTEAIESIRAEKRLSLGDGGYDLLKAVHTIAGQYSEIMCITNRGTGIGRLIVGPERALMYSTRHQDVEAIQDKRRQGLTVEQAIDAVLKDRGLKDATA